MKTNLDSLRAEIEFYLDSHGMIVFHSHPRSGDPSGPVFWDTQRHPDYKMFLAAAENAGAKLVTIHAREFTTDFVDDALEQAASSALPREERRAVEMRLKEMNAFAGYTCQIELTFDHASRVYIFDLRTDWFDDFNEILDRIEDAQNDRHREGPLGGGYYSKN